jgi:hypothetical protein
MTEANRDTYSLALQCSTLVHEKYILATIYDNDIEKKINSNVFFSTNSFIPLSHSLLMETSSSGYDFHNTQTFRQYDLYVQ